MKKLTNPRWIFVINTLPIIVLFVILGRDYYVIESLLSDENIKYWIIVSIVLSIYLLSNFIYSLICIKRCKEITLSYSLITLSISIAIIYFYMFNIGSIIPVNVPNWMMPGERFIYVGTFLMPTISYLIFVLVVKLTDLKKRFNTLISFGITILIPVILYLFFTTLLPLWHRIDLPYQEHVSAVLIITVTVFFIFFLIKAIYLLINKGRGILKKYQLVWKIPFTLILPLIGLYINNTNNVFGDFSSIWFYILTVITGILILLPDLKNELYRGLLFVARIITLSYSTYLMVVFLPYLPFSVLAIIAFGSGFLMLSPLALFLVHIDTILKDINYLKNKVSKRFIYLSIICCCSNYSSYSFNIFLYG